MSKNRPLTESVSAQIVTKSNALCRARWSSDSILEPRIIACVASRVNPGDTNSTVYDIPVSDILGKNYPGEHLDRLRQAAKKIISRTVEMDLNNGEGWGVYPLLTSCEYRKHTGIFTVEIHPKIRPHFLWFKDNILPYTQYDLTEYMKLPSMYSQRIFELLKSWKDKPEFAISIDELHKMLSTTDAYRSHFGTFRVGVLEKAYKDIHKYTSLRYTWVALKEGGKRVVAIRFCLTARKQEAEKARKAKLDSAKAIKNANKKAAAKPEALECAKAKHGICYKSERSRIVCSICNDDDYCKQVFTYYYRLFKDGLISVENDANPFATRELTPKEIKELTPIMSEHAQKFKL